MTDDTDCIPRQKQEEAHLADPTCFLQHLCKEAQEEKGRSTQVNEKNEEKYLIQMILVMAKASHKNVN